MKKEKLITEKEKTQIMDELLTMLYSLDLVNRDMSKDGYKYTWTAEQLKAWGVRIITTQVSEFELKNYGLFIDGGYDAVIGLIAQYNPELYED